MSEFTVQVKNFQSLSDVVIVVEDGLNIITGKTNAGKSAILRAVDNALFNTGVDARVKAGQRYSVVGLDNGTNKFECRRDSHGKNEKTMYKINSDKPMVKVGRGQLEDIAKLFNITDVRLANGIKEKINFWYQGQAPFLTDKTAGQLFEFLSQSSCEKYIKVVKKLDADKKIQKARIEGNNAMIDTLKVINNEKQKYIEDNAGFDDLYIEVITLNNEIDQFVKLQEIVDRREALKARIHIKTLELGTLEEALRKVDFDRISTEYAQIQEQAILVDVLKDCIGDLKKKSISKKEAQASLATLTPMLELKSKAVSSVEKAVAEITQLEVMVKDLTALIDSIKLKKTKKVNLQKSLAEVALSISNRDLESFNEDIVSIEYESKNLKELNELVERYIAKSNFKATKVTEFKKLEDAYIKAVEEFETFKESIGVCPYCDNTLAGTA